MRKKLVIFPRKFIKPSFVFLIEKKREGGEFTEDEIQKSKDSLNKLKDVKGNRWKRFILSSYIKYSTFQLKTQPKVINDDIDLSNHYMKNNLLILFQIYNLNLT